MTKRRDRLLHCLIPVIQVDCQSRFNSQDSKNSIWLSKGVNTTQHHEGISTGKFCFPMGWGCQDPHLPYRSGLREGYSPLESGKDASIGCPGFVIGWRHSGELENALE
jgi:hypothetical protein